MKSEFKEKPPGRFDLLIEAIHELAKVMKAKVAPVIHVAPANVHMPKNEAPSINVAAPKVEVAAPHVNVEVEAQKKCGWRHEVTARNRDGTIKTVVSTPIE
jgi:hypothetical protein